MTAFYVPFPTAEKSAGPDRACAHFTVLLFG